MPSGLSFKIFQEKEYMIAFIKVKSAKVSSALTQMRLQVARASNSCLNFCTLYFHEGFNIYSNKKPQSVNRSII